MDRLLISRISITNGVAGTFSVSVEDPWTDLFMISGVPRQDWLVWPAAVAVSYISALSWESKL